MNTTPPTAHQQARAIIRLGQAAEELIAALNATGVRHRLRLRYDRVRINDHGHPTMQMGRIVLPYLSGFPSDAGGFSWLEVSITYHHGEPLPLLFRIRGSDKTGGAIVYWGERSGYGVESALAHIQHMRSPLS